MFGFCGGCANDVQAQEYIHCVNQQIYERDIVNGNKRGEQGMVGDISELYDNGQCGVQ
jgi:hypothetical protein